MKSCLVIACLFPFLCLAAMAGDTTPGVISTIAGNGIRGLSGDGGPATSAQLNVIAGIAVDSAGNLYIADSDANAIRKVDPGGIISTVLGASGWLRYPIEVAVDAVGNLYIADLDPDEGWFVRGRIVKMTPAGGISTIGDSIFATHGRPTAVAVDSVGSVHIGFATLWDEDPAVYKVSPDGVVSTVCWPIYMADLALDSAGNLYFSGVSVNSSGIWKVDPESCRVTQVFDSPNTSSVAVDNLGNLFIAEKGATPRIWMVRPDGRSELVAGNGTKGCSGDGGPATSAQLNDPTSVAVDRLGNILVGDSGNLRIRRITRWIDYYNVSGMPYTSEDTSFWFNFWENVWYSGNKASQISWVGTHPPWEQ